MTTMTAGVATALRAVTVPPAEEVTPGVLGFAVVFALALVLLLLIRSMVGHLRKVRYSPEPGGEPPARPPALPPAGDGDGDDSSGDSSPAG